jgi:hypothetical protein
LVWNWGSMGWSSPYIPPCSDSLPLSWQQVYCLFMENQYESGADSGVSFSSSLSVSSSCWRGYGGVILLGFDS